MASFSLRMTGNTYSIDNKSTTPARIFFAQGCEVEVEVGGGGAEEDAPVPESTLVRPQKRRR